MATVKTSVTSKLLRTQEKLDIVKKEEATDRVLAKTHTHTHTQRRTEHIRVNLTCGYIKLSHNTQVVCKCRDNLDKDINGKI